MYATVRNKSCCYWSTLIGLVSVLSFRQLDWNSGTLPSQRVSSYREVCKNICVSLRIRPSIFPRLLGSASSSMQYHGFVKRFVLLFCAVDALLGQSGFYFWRCWLCYRNVTGKVWKINNFPGRTTYRGRFNKSLIGHRAKDASLVDRSGRWVNLIAARYHRGEISHYEERETSVHQYTTTFLPQRSRKMAPLEGSITILDNDPRRRFERKQKKRGKPSEVGLGRTHLVKIVEVRRWKTSF